MVCSGNQESRHAQPKDYEGHDTAGKGNTGEKTEVQKLKEHHHCHQGRPDHVVRPEGFMEPCLLLLLSERTSYGYDLISRLQEFGFGENQDPGMVYRHLRRLERRGMIESRWDTSGAGPARRVYRMTDDGSELLAVWTETIKLNIGILSGFLNRYQTISEQESSR